MSKEIQVLETFIQEQKSKIDDLSQQLLMISTRYKLLEEEHKVVKAKLNEYEIINKKKKNTIQGFRHTKKIIEG